MTLGENIKRIRQEKKLTQKQLGNLCTPKMADSAIRRYEAGKANPKIETVQKIATALGVSLFEIIDSDTLEDIYHMQMFDKRERNRLLYLQYLGYEITEPSSGDNVFTIYHDGYKYTIPYEEPSAYFDLICEVIDSYATNFLDEIIKEHSIRKEKIGIDH